MIHMRFRENRIFVKPYCYNINS